MRRGYRSSCLYVLSISLWWITFLLRNIWSQLVLGKEKRVAFTWNCFRTFVDVIWCRSRLHNYWIKSLCTHMSPHHFSPFGFGLYKSKLIKTKTKPLFTMLIGIHSSYHKTKHKVKYMYGITNMDIKDEWMIKKLNIFTVHRSLSEITSLPTSPLNIV